MNHAGKKGIGWYLAGAILSLILLVLFAGMLSLGIAAFDTADYPAWGNAAFYPVESDEILPRGAVAVVNLQETPQRGVPVAFLNEETQHIDFRYYYGEENGKMLLTDIRSENEIEITADQMRGCVKNYIPQLGYVLMIACTLTGVCLNLAATLLMIFALLLILNGLRKVVQYNRSIAQEAPAKEAAPQEELPECAEDAPEETLPEENAAETISRRQPVRINDSYTVEFLSEDGADVAEMLFRGDAADILKLAKIIRTIAEKRRIDAITVEEQYEENCLLRVTAPKQNAPLIHSIIGMLREREK